MDDGLLGLDDGRNVVVPLGPLERILGPGTLDQIISNSNVTEVLTVFKKRKNHSPAVFCPIKYGTIAGAAGADAVRVLMLPHRTARLIAASLAEIPGAPALRIVTRVPIRSVAALDAVAADAVAARRGGLYEYQAAVLDDILRRSRLPARNVYLFMATGQGKTPVAAAFIGARGQPALFIAPASREIARKGLETLRSWLPGWRCALFSSKTAASCTADNFDVVVIVVNSARTQPAEFFQGWGTVVIDEAHEFHSPENRKVLPLACSGGSCVLGLSASPHERKDGMDFIVDRYLGPPADAAAAIEAAGLDPGDMNFDGRILVARYTAPAEYRVPVKVNDINSAVMSIGRIIEDPDRMKLLGRGIEWILTLHEGAGPAADRRRKFWGLDRGGRHSVAVFAEHRDFLPKLAGYLVGTCVDRAAFACPELETPASAETPANPANGAAGPAVLRGGAGDAAVDGAARCRVVLMTYGYGRRGIDLKHLTAGVSATPRRGGSTQILGRVTRKGSDQGIVRVWLDLVDCGSFLEGQLTDRVAAYGVKGWPVKKISVSHTSVEAADFGSAFD